MLNMWSQMYRMSPLLGVEVQELSELQCSSVPQNRSVHVCMLSIDGNLAHVRPHVFILFMWRVS